jgi:hypothetical protein
MSNQMNLLANDNRQDILYTDTHTSYRIESVNDNLLKIVDFIIPIANLERKHQVVTTEYCAGMMNGFQLRKNKSKLQYRWFRINTRTKKLLYGLWNEIF